MGAGCGAYLDRGESGGRPEVALGDEEEEGGGAEEGEGSIGVWKAKRGGVLGLAVCATGEVGEGEGEEAGLTGVGRSEPVSMRVWRVGRGCSRRRGDGGGRLPLLLSKLEPDSWRHRERAYRKAQHWTGLGAVQLLDLQESDPLPSPLFCTINKAHGTKRTYLLGGAKPAEW